MQNYQVKFREYYCKNIETFDYILGGLRNNITGQLNFRVCVNVEEKLTITIR
jgi:hypothetical protein